jgi:large subunit ribosomal protein L15
MKEHELSSPGAHRDRKRLGRGVGSGYGKTAGRGTKGQKARAGGNISRFFQGGQNPIHKQLPYKRGFTNNFRVEYNAINLEALDQFEAGTVVTVDLLAARRLAQRLTWQDGERRLLVKILGDGELTKPLTVEAHKFSKSAREKIEAAGGQAVVLEATAAADEAVAEA